MRIAGAQRLNDRVEQEGAGHDQVGAARVEAGQPESLLHVALHHVLARAMQFLRGEATVVDLVALEQRPAAQGDLSEAEAGAGGRDEAVEARRPNLFREGTDFGADPPDQPALVACGQGIARHEGIRQADDPEREAAREVNLAAGSQRHLHRPAADVHDDRGAARRIDAVDGREVDEATLLEPRDDARPDAGALGDRGQELAPVRRFADGAGRGRDDLVRAPRHRKLAEPAQGLERGGHGAGRQGAAVQAARAEADHFLLAIDRLERKVRANLHHDHVDGVGADVDGGQAHTVRPSAVQL